MVVVGVTSCCCKDVYIGVIVWNCFELRICSFPRPITFVHYGENSRYILTCVCVYTTFALDKYHKQCFVSSFLSPDMALLLASIDGLTVPYTSELVLGTSSVDE